MGYKIIVHSTKYHFHSDLGLKRRCWTSDWSNPQCRTHMLKTVAWMMLSSYGSQTKSIHVSRTEKFTEWLTVRICATKNKDVEEKRFLRTRMAFSESVMMFVKVYQTALIFFDPGAKVVKSVIIVCFYHNTCCLPYVRSLTSFSFSEI